MEMLSLIGIITGLILMILLAYKGYSLIWVAPVCAFVVALFSMGAGLGEGKNLLTIYTVDYMQGTGNYVTQWFPIFLLGAIYGKVMDVTGSAQSLADMIIKLIGKRFVVLAVLIPSIALAYGGVSLFVIAFIMYPMGYAIFRKADLPRILLPSIIIFGTSGVAMTSIPGTPQIQNLIPMDFFGTTPMAAPGIGIAASVLVLIPGYFYLEHQAQAAKKNGMVFIPDPEMTSAAEDDNARPSWHWLSGLVPLIVVFVTLNIFGWHAVVSLILGIAVCYLFNLNKLAQLPSALTEGAKGSVTAIMNTACAVGFGSVIKMVPGFALLTTLLVGNVHNTFSLLLSESMSTALLSGATGSASGGLSIALSAFADNYLAVAQNLGISPEVLHRVASVAAGSFDKLPHNGALITLLTVCHCTHKESYKDMFVVSVLIPMIALILLIGVLGIIL